MPTRRFDTRRIEKADILRQIELIGRPVTTTWDGLVMIAQWEEPPLAPEKRGRKMGKLREAADRLARSKKMAEEEADKLLAKLDEHDQLLPEAMAKGHEIVDDMHQDVDGMIDDLRQIKNQ